MKAITRLVILVLVGWSLSLGAQEKNSLKVDLGADFMSKYVWRGTQFGGSWPSIQPSFSLNYGPLTLGAWGAYTVAGPDPYQEFDLFLSADLADGMFTLTVTDYYFPDTSDYKYFDYKKNQTGHILEGAVSFNGTDKLPLSVLFAMNFYGADAIRIDDDPASADFNQKTGIQYSNYLEVGYDFTVQKVDMKAFAGMTFNKPREANASTGYVGETGFYGTGPGLINLGVTASRSLQITSEYALPLQASVITNPQAQKIFLVFGFSL